MCQLLRIVGIFAFGHVPASFERQSILQGGHQVRDDIEFEFHERIRCYVEGGSYIRDQAVGDDSLDKLGEAGILQGEVGKRIGGVRRWRLGGRKWMDGGLRRSWSEGKADERQHEIKAEEKELTVKARFNEGVPLGVQQIDQNTVHQFQVFVLFLKRNGDEMDRWVGRKW